MGCIFIGEKNSIDDTNAVCFCVVLCFLGVCVRVYGIVGMGLHVLIIICALQCPRC